MINRITIKNFKSLRDVTLELKPLTIIIGPNASGKSNLLDALEAIQRLVQYKGTTMLDQEGEQPTISLDNVLWRKAEPMEEIYWQFDYTLPTGDDDDDHEQQDLAKHVDHYSYSIAIQRNGLEQDTQTYISREKFEPFKLEDSVKSDFINRNNSTVMVQGSEESILSEISATDLALHFYAQESFPGVLSSQRYIQEWRFFKILPDIIRSGTNQQHGKSHNLLKDGSNLANVLHYLRENDPEGFDYIQTEMREMLNFAALRTVEENESLVKQASGARIYLEAEENAFAGLKPFGADSLSHGTLNLLALLTILGVSDLAPLICIEEPEPSTHRQLIRSIAHYLHEAAYDTQLIVTTHSPEFLDHFNPYEHEHVQVLIAYRDEEGATQFVPLHQVPNVEEWLNNHTLGETWMMRQIEEVLEITHG